jgi:hypothetical protein
VQRAKPATFFEGKQRQDRGLFFIGAVHVPAHTQDIALRAVGRNVVNFQLLEGYLKQLAKLQQVDGTVLEIQRKLDARTERLSKSTLGTAIAGWLNILDHAQPATLLHDDLFDATARIAFSVELTDGERNRHAAALESLLAERNTLIHTGLRSVDWESPEVCRKLVGDLDAQNERIIKEIELIRPILIRLRESASAISEVDWPEAASEKKDVLEEAGPNPQPDQDP